MTTNRRQFLKYISMAATAGMMPVNYSYANNRKIIVIGGGIAGSHFAVKMKLAEPASSVVLVNDSKGHISSGRYSGLHNALQPMSTDLLKAVGVEIIFDRVKQLDPVNRSVILKNHHVLKADILVLAPGIDYKWHELNSVMPGLNINDVWMLDYPAKREKFLHAVKSVADGENVVMNIPASDIRYPASIYENAEIIARYFERYKPASKLFVIDQNPSLSESRKFSKFVTSANESRHIEWVTLRNNESIDYISYKKNVLSIDGEKIASSLFQITPPQCAGKIATSAGLNQGMDWCQVNPQSFESELYRQVYVLGDANNVEPHNKSALLATYQARGCCAALI